MPSADVYQLLLKVLSWPDGRKRWSCHLLTEFGAVLTLWGPLWGSCGRVKRARRELKFREVFIRPTSKRKISGKRHAKSRMVSNMSNGAWASSIFGSKISIQRLNYRTGQQPITPLRPRNTSGTGANCTSANKITVKVCIPKRSPGQIWGIIKQKVYEEGSEGAWQLIIFLYLFFILKQPQATWPTNGFGASS